MKLHTKYYMRFLWLCRLTGLADSQMRTFIASLLPGGQKRLGDYTFKLLSVKRAGKDVLYSIEVYIDDDDDDDDNKNLPNHNHNSHHNNSNARSRNRLVLKSPVLLYASSRNVIKKRMRKGRKLAGAGTPAGGYQEIGEKDHVL